jgi:hypothetical protein
MSGRPAATAWSGDDEIGVSGYSCGGTCYARVAPLDRHLRRVVLGESGAAAHRCADLLEWRGASRVKPEVPGDATASTPPPTGENLASIGAKRALLPIRRHLRRQIDRKSICAAVALQVFRQDSRKNGGCAISQRGDVAFSPSATR